MKLPGRVLTMDTKTMSNSLPCELSIEMTCSFMPLSANRSAMAFFYALYGVMM